MRFRTELPAEKREYLLPGYKTVVLAGSCFAGNIAERMQRALWPAANPFGVLYNPLSIAEVLRACALMNREEADRWFGESLLNAGPYWMSWMFDSTMVAPTPGELTARFRDMRDDVIAMLEQASTLILTFGTCWVYRKDGKVVSNCHKRPSALFSRDRASIDDMYREMSALIADLKRRYPQLEFIFTVSPVRHLRDGVHANTLSKAALHLLVDRLCTECPGCHYFPAYELMMDDLRDYRFYAEDMAHPSAQAVDYIWEYFRNTMMDEVTRQAVQQGEKIRKRMDHRPIIGDLDPAFVAETRRLYDEFRSRWLQ